MEIWISISRSMLFDWDWLGMEVLNCTISCFSCKMAGFRFFYCYTYYSFRRKMFSFSFCMVVWGFSSESGLCSDSFSSSPPSKVSGKTNCPTLIFLWAFIWGRLPSDTSKWSITGETSVSCYSKFSAPKAWSGDYWDMCCSSFIL